MKTITNDIKEKYFRFPGKDFVGFNRRLSTVMQGGHIWTVAQKEDIHGTTLVVSKKTGDKTERIEKPIGPKYYRPALVAGKGDVPAMVWNEYENGKWFTKFAELNDKKLSIKKEETVYSSERLCMPPEGIYYNNKALVCWTAVIDGHMRLLTAIRNNGSWEVSKPLSDKSTNVYRPTICATDDSVCIFWDQYKNSYYEVAGARLFKEEWANIKPIGQTGERWFCPNVAATGNDEIYVTWAAVRNVSDDLGIVDYHAVVMVGRLKGNQVEILQDENGSEIADLREGLLASELSKGYLGLRRYPQLTVDVNDNIWCCWEVRIEDEGTAVSGYLAVRSFDGTTWSNARLLADPGYGYALPPKQTAADLTFSYLKFAQDGLDVMNSATIAGNAGTLYKPNSSRWDRWHEFDIEPLVKPKRKAEVNGKSYSIFWADTHCHCNVSADAEGEPDEIIHYGRDVAGLDAMCLIDNDFYPHKTLTPAEWQMHQENSRLFTKKNEFVLFPGYEFTYHRKDMKPYPDFNHRCVIYPGPGGELHRRIDVNCDSDYKLLEKLKSTNAMCYPHHSSYKLIDQEQEWNIEACSSWRTVLEETDFTIKQLLEGKKLGFIGSSDAHRSNPGLGGALTGLFAPELTPEALFDAYKNRRIIATQGFAAFIDFRVAGLFIGSEGSVEGAPKITVEIEAPKEIEYACVLRDGEVIHRVEPGSDKSSIAFTDEGAEKGNHFYYFNMKLVGKPGYNANPSDNTCVPFTYKSKYPHNLAKARGVFAWTSPIWTKQS